MEGSIIFYTYGSTLELNGQQFEAGRLTEDLLNLSPDDYHPLHERMVRIRTLMDIYEYVRKSELWWKLNDEMEQLCQELRRYTVFRLLPDDCYDAFFSVIREITGQFSLFPPEEHSLSEDDQTKLLSASAEEFFQSDDGDSDPEISLGLLDLFRRREGSEEKGELFYYEMFRLLGACEDTWSAYKKYIDRYMMYLHDIRAFVPTIRNFIKFILSTLTTNGPESYAAALYGFYNDDRTAEKLIVNPITYHGDCYRRHDEYMLSYVPRELPDGSMAICQEHVTDSLQALMKADYMLALNSGHNIRRCIICGKYFMLKSGVHALYCEGACPHAPGYTCRQFGTVEVQKELAKNNPKVKAKLTAFSRITKDMQRGAISQEDARRAKDHVRDRLYDALRSPDISVEEFSEQISTAQVYEYCRITRVSKPRGRPPKAKAGGPMTNEELVRRYYGGDERALEELYRRNLGLIRRIARETAREFNCLHMDRERPGELSGYTKTILEDLCGEGALEFLTRVQSREYDESRAVLATYLYPHLKGRMTRWLEQHIGNLSLSKHEMDAVRQAQRLYHSGQFSIEEIAEKMDVLLEQAVKHIRYNTHFVGVNDLIPGSYDGDPFERLMPGNLSVSAEQVVYRKVCIELLQELFDALPKKDRDILGKFYGVFGFEKTSLKEIGMYHMMKESAVEKAKERAVTKLKKAYPGSRLQIWRNVHRMIRRPILPAKDDRALRRSFTTSTLRNQESGRS